MHPEASIKYTAVKCMNNGANERQPYLEHVAQGIYGSQGEFNLLLEALWCEKI